MTYYHDYYYQPFYLPTEYQSVSDHHVRVEGYLEEDELVDVWTQSNFFEHVEHAEAQSYSDYKERSQSFIQTFIVERHLLMRDMMQEMTVVKVKKSLPALNLIMYAR